MNLLSLTLLVTATLTGCSEDPTASAMEGGERVHAIKLIRGFGCGGCHDIPGVPGADGDVGPPLHAIGRRVFIAGRLRNTRENMVRWLRDPQGIDPGNAMPSMGIGEKDAGVIAAYLATLR